MHVFGVSNGLFRDLLRVDKIVNVIFVIESFSLSLQIAQGSLFLCDSFVLFEELCEDLLQG